MSKIVIQNKRGKITITNRLSYPETVNEWVNNAIASGMFEGFLPVSIKQKRKETRMECSVQGLLTLNQYFEGLVSKKMFLDFAYQIVTVIKNCEKNRFSANNLDLHRDRVFVDPITKSVKCIYWPIVNNQRSDPPHLFLKQLAYDISFSSHEDNAYLEQYAAFFDGYTPFSINSFERLLIKLQGKKMLGDSRIPSGSDEKKVKDAVPVKDIEYDPFPRVKDIPRTEREQERKQAQNDYIFCPECGAKNINGANFCSTCGNKLNHIDKPEPITPPTIDFGTTVLGDSTCGTVVLGFDESEKLIYPTIIRIKTNDRFTVDRPVFRIGTGQAYCDLLIRDNAFISRNHADIITKNNRYYVVDKNSKNRTFVDGKAIAKETEVEIFDGTTIKLANEEFSFSLDG